MITSINNHTNKNNNPSFGKFSNAVLRIMEQPEAKYALKINGITDKIVKELEASKTELLIGTNGKNFFLKPPKNDKDTAELVMKHHYIWHQINDLPRAIVEGLEITRKYNDLTSHLEKMIKKYTPRIEKNKKLQIKLEKKLSKIEVKDKKNKLKIEKKIAKIKTTNEKESINEPTKKNKTLSRLTKKQETLIAKKKKLTNEINLINQDFDNFKYTKEFYEREIKKLFPDYQKNEHGKSILTA